MLFIWSLEIADLHFGSGMHPRDKRGSLHHKNINKKKKIAWGGKKQNSIIGETPHFQTGIRLSQTSTKNATK